MFTKPLRGIIPPVITPMIDNDTLDVIGLENLLNRMIKGGVSGVFILGTSGEAQNISYNVRKELIKENVSDCRETYSGIGRNYGYEFFRIFITSCECGLVWRRCLCCCPPYYFAPGQAELIQYYNDLANQLPLPLFLYNMPSHVKVMIEPETVLALSENPNIIGLKDSSANGVYFQKLIYLLRNKPEFTLLCGPEEMTAEVILMGGHGGVNGGANLFPELYVALYDAAASKDFEKLAELQSQVLRVSLSLYNIGKYASSYIKGVKTALNLLGVCSDYMAEPFHKFKDAERAVVKKKLIELGLDI